MAGLRGLIAILGAALAALSLGLPAFAQARIALIVANADYQGALPDLDNPLNDAEAVKAALESVGFSVDIAPNVDERGFGEALARYRTRLNAAGEDAIGLFYFTGHGAQWQGINYLIPAGAVLRDKADLPRETLRLRDVFDALRIAGNATNFVIVDACRNAALSDPLDPTKTAELGLARADTPTGVKLVFSAQPGSTATDGPRGGLSPFAAAFAELIATPGAPEEEVFRRVATRVYEATDRRQQPWPEGTLIGETAFVFKEAAPSEPRLIRRTRPDGTVEELTTGSAPSTPAVDGAEIAWSYLKDSTDAAALERFAAENKDHPRAGEALRRAASLTTSAPSGGSAATSPASGGSTAAGREGGGDAVARAVAAAERGAPVSEREFRDCADCPVMVVIPAGSFTMGSPADELGRDDDEGPQRTVTIPRAFAVGKFEVTWDEWEACVSVGVCSGASSDRGWGRGRRPVIDVSWSEAQTYATWLASTTGKPYRLPAESEWEYAARAGSQERYSWGDASPSCDAAAPSGANYSACRTNKPLPVGSFAANAFGLHDMHGNVQEWVSDCYVSGYRGAPSDGSPRREYGCSDRGYRGGSFAASAADLRSANRGTYTARAFHARRGIRLAMTPET